MGWGLDGGGGILPGPLCATHGAATLLLGTARKAALQFGFFFFK